MNKLKTIIFIFLAVFALLLFSDSAFAADIATQGASKGCETLSSKLAEINACPLCPLYEVILKTDQTMATKSFAALATSFRSVIIMVMGLFIAYQTLITVGAFTKQDAPKYITTLLTQGFKVLVAALLLTNSDWIYDYVINPLMKAGLEFGLALLFEENTISDFSTLSQEAQGTLPDGVIGKDVLGSVMAAVRLLIKKAATLPAIGGSLMCISYHEGAKWLINLSMFIEGLMINVFGWAIILSTSFLLLDAVVRFGIFCSLLPFLIAAWPFKVTRSYTATGWKIFINSFFNFVMMGLVISVNTELVDTAVTGGKGSKDALEKAINGNNIEDLKNLMDISGVDFLVLVACGMFAFKLVGEIGNLANEISGTSGGTAIGSKIGGVAMQAANRVRKVGQNVAGKGLKTAGEAAMNNTKAGRAIKSGVKNMAAAVGLGASNPNGSGGASGGYAGFGGAGNPGGNSGNPSGSAGSS